VGVLNACATNGCGAKDGKTKKSKEKVVSKIGVRDHQKGGSDRKPTRSSGTIWTTARAPGPLD
tara:strand:+ start:568 stop:756 length:189 start_codon:yes stop_codon:yes gene_type:complete